MSIRFGWGLALLLTVPGLVLLMVRIVAEFKRSSEAGFAALLMSTSTIALLVIAYFVTHNLIDFSQHRNARLLTARVGGSAFTGTVTPRVAASFAAFPIQHRGSRNYLVQFDESSWSIWQGSNATRPSIVIPWSEVIRIEVGDEHFLGVDAETREFVLAGSESTLLVAALKHQADALRQFDTAFESHASSAQAPTPQSSTGGTWLGSPGGSGSGRPERPVVSDSGSEKR